MPDPAYRGRFAPSPTGPLHFGSLLAALASYLDARAHHGTWLVRMEDLDRPRTVPGAADDILRTLEAFGLHWDETVLYQSRRDAAYREALQQLIDHQLAYPCGCTRKQLQTESETGPEGPIYPGTCRTGLPEGRTARTWRVRISEAPIHFIDTIQGEQQQSLADICGDFIVRRADRLFAYQLAVVVDDAEQRITDVIRGADLLLSTGRQCYLQQQLGLVSPRYGHLPVAVNRQGDKLSKQTHAPPLTGETPTAYLLAALECLGQALPESGQDARVEELLTFAVHHWSRERVPARKKISLPIAGLPG